MQTRQYFAPIVAGLRLRNRRGSIVLVATGGLFVLASFGLFAMDVGSIYRQRRIAQTAADAGALAGAWEVFRGSPGTLSANALSATGTNGFTNGANNTTVTVSNPPTSGFGSSTADTRFVQVRITQTFPTVGLRFFGINSVQITAHATAGAGGKAISCLFVTDPSKDAAVDMENADIKTTCGMSVNSTSPSAITFNNSNASIEVRGGGLVSVTGGVDNSKGAALTPAPSTGVPPGIDPLATLAGPAIPTPCTAISLSVTSTTTLNPGTYCNGLDLEKGTITFASGTYVFCGGLPNSFGKDAKGYSIYTKGGNVIIRDDGGAGVLFYFTRCVIGGNTYDYATPMNMEASSDIVLHAATTGPWAGIVFFQDRNAPTNLGPSQWGASSTSELFGMVYMPNTGIDLTTGGAVLKAAALITRSIHLDSQSLVDITNIFGGAPPPLKRLTLVE